MGVVYKARQVALNRVVALKMILAGGHAGAEARARFRAEAEAVARLQHPNIVQVFEVGEHEGRPFFSLEFVDGGSLQGRLDGTPQAPAEAAALVRTLARAMHAAHEKGVVHRDLKPANVLLAADGTPKVTDFGLAKSLDEEGHTQTGEIMGTPSYMAPEQAGGDKRQIGPTTDVYALGAILYELLTGRPPFRGPTPLDTILQVVSDEPVPPRRLQPKAPCDLERVCPRTGGVNLLLPVTSLGCFAYQRRPVGSECSGGCSRYDRGLGGPGMRHVTSGSSRCRRVPPLPPVHPGPRGTD
jgi:serine/threonine protein kinase